MRECFIADQTRYISPSGNDSNNGSQEAPFFSLQGAWDYAQRTYDLCGYKLVFVVADGVYPPLAAYGRIPGTRGIDSVTFRGNLAHSDCCLISNPHGHAVEVSHDALLKLDGVMVEALKDGVVATEGGVSLGTVAFGECGWAHMQAVGGRARIALTAEPYYYILGSAEYHALSEQNALITMTGVAQILPAGLVFNTFAYVDQAGNADFTGWTWIGNNVIGKRFEAVSGGSVSVNGGPTTVLPGTIPGVVSGGHYV